MVVNNYGKKVFELTNVKLNENYSSEIDLEQLCKRALLHQDLF